LCLLILDILLFLHLYALLSRSFFSYQIWVFFPSNRVFPCDCREVKIHNQAEKVEYDDCRDGSRASHLKHWHYGALSTDHVFYLDRAFELPNEKGTFYEGGRPHHVEKLVAGGDTITEKSEVKQRPQRGDDKCYPGERIPSGFDDSDEVQEGAQPQKNVCCTDQVLSKTSTEAAAFVFPA